jgi:hypothetical protein
MRRTIATWARNHRGHLAVAAAATPAPLGACYAAVNRQWWAVVACLLLEAILAAVVAETGR